MNPQAGELSLDVDQRRESDRESEAEDYPRRHAYAGPYAGGRRRDAGQYRRGDLP